MAENPIEDMQVSLPGDGTEDSDTDIADSSSNEADAEAKKTGHFSWHIPSLEKLRQEVREKKVYGPEFEVHGTWWRFLVFPNGNDSPDQFSVFLDVARKSELRPGWHRHAQFAITLVNQKDPTQSLCRDATHIFYERESDWGFVSFTSQAKLNSATEGFLTDGGLILNVDVTVVRDYVTPTTWGTRMLWRGHDSYKETGFVGLKNQGATCYLNSLLQYLFHLGIFRKAVYQMPTEKEKVGKSIPLALQRLFYRLQFEQTAVPTKELTQSFGWTTFDSFTQHDVQELNRVLMDELETKMKGTSVEGTIERLFRGSVSNYISCINVPVQSLREEHYYDISLNVKGCGDIYRSFDQYTEEEMLDGQNQYRAEGYGLQDAKKGVRFKNLPPVLCLQLKRFEYSVKVDANVKLNDEYAFYPVIELSKYVVEPEKDTSYCYHLHAVLVHSGDVHGGHYYAFLRTGAKSQWHKFDDDYVTKATEKEAIDDNFGGVEELPLHLDAGRKFSNMRTKCSNAYMLVYVRESDSRSMFEPVPQQAISQHLIKRFEEERQAEEKRRKELDEAHLYMNVRLVTSEDMLQHDQEKTDLVALEKVRELRLRKNATLSQLREKLSKELNIPGERMRFRHWITRRNQTFRPADPYPPAKEQVPISELRPGSALTLWLEVSEAPDGEPLFPLTEGHACIFFKVYDPFVNKMRYLGHVCWPVTTKVASLIPVVRRMLGYDESVELEIYEEIKPEMVDKVDVSQTLENAELGNGDVLVLQRALSDEDKASVLNPNAQRYYAWLRDRVQVRMRDFDAPDKDAFGLDLTKSMLYPQVAQAVAARLSWDPECLQFTSYSEANRGPYLKPVSRAARLTLQEMLQHYLPTSSNILYYKKLDMPLAELENMVTLKIQWQNAAAQPVGAPHVLVVKKSCTIADVLLELSSRVEMTGTGRIRLMEVFRHKILSVPDLAAAVTLLTHNQYATLVAEEIAREELDVAPETGKVLPVAHTNRNTSMVSLFGNPFMMLVRSNDTVATLRPRLQAKLGVPAEEFATWRLAMVTYGRMDFLMEGDLIWEELNLHGQQFLVLEHLNDQPLSQHLQHPSWRRTEHGIKFRRTEDDSDSTEDA
mmetsp:Transcript_46802/g.117943  ORF Transcript_46802/g.117943 Transcript_46802/m.117943 type:complete len:1105 (-) Transcript_46802:40-3354(-)|eukprot:CAMPEP_0177652400 /NCGR_PEP_ID=MMETSP0447-20121125/13106_1 /TAXON_ID=0 /ORGANISM="Stygamoeba regulata, Strain BSH-02190019" /LENGTH=1104 /DNA_ID=CAMNT_0019155635 /DNA_START=74 /DNA_END=3388 /DNA_ORIENTATION=+